MIGGLSLHWGGSQSRWRPRQPSRAHHRDLRYAAHSVPRSGRRYPSHRCGDRHRKRGYLTSGLNPHQASRHHPRYTHHDHASPPRRRRLREASTPTLLAFAQGAGRNDMLLTCDPSSSLRIRISNSSPTFTAPDCHHLMVFLTPEKIALVVIPFMLYPATVFIVSAGSAS